MSMVAAVAAGGALGALARWVVGLAMVRLMGHGFPWGTLVVNVTGALVMGLFAGALTYKISLSPEVRALVTVGFLGSFTTFSTFSLDLVSLWERGEWMATTFYLVASVVLSVTGLLVGLRLWRMIV